MTIDYLRLFCRHSILTTTEVAKKLNVSRQRVYKLIKNGELSPIKQTPQTSLFLLADIQQYLIRQGNHYPYPAKTPPMFFDRSGVPKDNIKYFRNNRHKLDDIQSVYVYFDEIDAVLGNHYMPSEDIRFGSLIGLDIPGLILQDTRGNQMWLRGCNCGYGGAGPNGTATILKECGFSEEQISYVFNYRIVRLLRDEKGNTEISYHNSEIDSFDADSGHANLYFSENRLVLVQDNFYLRTKPLVNTLIKYMAFIPHPVEFMLFPTDEMAKEHGYFLPGIHGEEVYNIIIQDISGKQLWLSTFVDELEPIELQQDVKDLLDLTGFQLPTVENNKYFKLIKNWLYTPLRKRIIQPVHLKKT